MITIRSKINLTTALLALICISQAHAENFLSKDLSVIGDSIKSVPEETKEILRYPVDHTNEFIQYAAGIGALIIADRPVTQFYQDHVEDPIKDFKLPDAPDPFKNIGTGGTDGWLVLGISSTYLTGLVTNNTYTQKVGIAATKAIGYSFALDQVILKTLTGRNRPHPH